MTLSISLLGSLIIECDDRRLGKFPKKARALLAYLAAQDGRPVTRERLADLLWPYQGSDQARHSLRNCLLELRKGLSASAGGCLAADFSTCRLRDTEIDLDRFEQLGRSRSPLDLQRAAGLYRGEFLADFAIDSEPFQEWLAAERDRALEAVCAILQRLTAVHDEAGEHDAAIHSARRLVSLDALSEFGQRTLIRAYARAGRRGEALRQYNHCAETLKRELGVAPDAETQTLAAEIARSGGAGELVAFHRAGPIAGAGAADRADRGGRAEDYHDRGEAMPGAARLHWPCVLSNIAVGVAPLRNLTGDPDRQYLVDAFTDDLVTDLMQYNRGLALKPMSEERGALGNLLGGPERSYEYVVTGSAQRSSPGTFRINMRICDAVTSEYLWAGRHEFRPDDLTSIQTKITKRISRELHILVLQQASRRALGGSDGGLGVNECLARANGALKGPYRAETAAEAQRWFLAAIARDPRNVEALTLLAGTCQLLVSNPWWGDPQSLASASDLGREAAGIALELAPGHAFAKCVQGMLHSAAGQLGEAARAFEQALALDRGLAAAHGFAGYNAALLGRARETLPAMERAMRLDRTDRRHSIWYFFGGFAELLLGRPEAAIALLRKSLERNPSYGGAQLFLMAALSLTGQEGDAVQMASSFREQYPEHPANAFEQLWLSRSSSPTYRVQIEPVFDRLRALGIAS
jgi:DNA-binding SARP family transcriptional activator/TolB-like protein